MFCFVLGQFSMQLLLPWYVFNTIVTHFKVLKKYISFNLTETKHVKSLKTCGTDPHACTHRVTDTHHHCTKIQSNKVLVDDTISSDAKSNS